MANKLSCYKKRCIYNKKSYCSLDSVVIDANGACREYTTLVDLFKDGFSWRKALPSKKGEMYTLAQIDGNSLTLVKRANESAKPWLCKNESCYAHRKEFSCCMNQTFIDSAGKCGERMSTEIAAHLGLEKPESTVTKKPVNTVDYSILIARRYESAQVRLAKPFIEHKNTIWGVVGLVDSVQDALAFIKKDTPSVLLTGAIFEDGNNAKDLIKAIRTDQSLRFQPHIVVVTNLHPALQDGLEFSGADKVFYEPDSDFSMDKLGIYLMSTCHDAFHKTNTPMVSCIWNELSISSNEKEPIYAELDDALIKRAQEKHPSPFANRHEEVRNEGGET